MNTESEFVPFVNVQQHNIALLFANYLATLNIVAQVHKTEQGFAICCSQEYVEQAIEVFAEFIKQPNHPKYQQAAWRSGEVTEVSAYAPSLMGSFKTQFFSHAGAITLTIFAACWCIFIATLMGFGADIFQRLQFFQQVNFDSFIEAPYRLLGPALFHFSWLHIVFNTMWWWQLGGSIEKTLGKGALINLFLLSAIVSNVGQFIVSGPNFGGLSGVVYALVGYVWWFGWLAPERGLTLSKPIVGFLLFWLLLGFAQVLPVNIANTAHLLGLVSGCVLAWLKIKWFR